MKQAVTYCCLSALALTSLLMPGCGAGEAGPDVGPSEVMAEISAYDADPDAYAAEDAGTHQELPLFAVSLWESCSHEDGV